MKWALIPQALFVLLCELANNIVYFHFDTVIFLYEFYPVRKGQKCVSLTTSRPSDFAHLRKNCGSEFHIVFIVSIRA